MNILVESVSIKNSVSDKPNEDAFLIDDQKHIYLVCDGVTRDRIDGIYPNPSPSATVANLFLLKCYSKIVEELELGRRDISSVLFNSFIYGNRQIGIFNSLFLDEFIPGTVAVGIILDEKYLYYCYIGDCIGLQFNVSEVIEFTEMQTKLIQQYKSFFTSQQIRSSICNNPNHPYSYGVLNGNNSVPYFLKYGYLSLDACDVILLATDGLEKLLRYRGYKFFRDMSCVQLLEESEKLEVFGSNRSDDKTIVKLTFYPQ